MFSVGISSFNFEFLYFKVARSRLKFAIAASTRSVCRLSRKAGAGVRVPSCVWQPCVAAHPNPSLSPHPHPSFFPSSAHSSPLNRAAFESRAAQRARVSSNRLAYRAIHPLIHYCPSFSVPASSRKKKTETGFLLEWSPDKAVGRRGPPLLCVQTDGG